MKMTRTAAKAKNGLHRTTNMEIPIFKVLEKEGSVSITAEPKYVPEFGNPNTHHDYILEITADEFISMIKAINASSGEGREVLKMKISSNAADILKLLKMCAE